MFIIFGSPRSGTTLLAATLELHTEIVIPRETDFIVPLLFIVERVADETIGRRLIADLIISTRYYPHSIGYYLDPEEVAAVIQHANYSAAELVTAIFDAVSAKAGRRLAGDKSPNDLEQVGIFQKTNMFSSEKIKVIHLIRDVRDVVLSIRQMPWGSPNIHFGFPRLWNAHNLMLRAVCRKNPDRYQLVRFEDMVTDPQKILRNLADFLGVEFQPAMLDAEKRGGTYFRRADSHHQNLKRPFLAERAGVWKREMAPDIQKICERQAAEGLEIFGYEIASTSPATIGTALTEVLKTSGMRTMEDFSRHLKNLDFRPRTLIDVGAAFGTLPLYGTFPDAYFFLFEPVPEFERYLQLTLKNHRGEYHRCALSDSNETQDLLVGTKVDRATLVHDGVPVEGSRLIPVEVRTLDGFFKERDVERPVLLKTDCQGADLKVIKGGESFISNCDVIIMEVSMFSYHGPNAPDFNEVICFMKDRGFVVYDLFDFLMRPHDGALGQLNVAFVQEKGSFRAAHRW